MASSGETLITRRNSCDCACLSAKAIAARDFEMPFEEDYKGIAQLGRDTEETPIDVPLHPGAEKWFREHTQG